MIPRLPELSNTPQKFSDCCLTVSTTLLRKLNNLIPPPQTALSIGCGTGVLEALLLKHYPHIKIDGAEVRSASKLTQYLPPASLHIVSGTWDLCDKAADTGCWMFVYPRDPSLLVRYAERFGSGQVVSIVWLGPIVDWPDFEPVLRTMSERSGWAGLDISEGNEAGLMPYEMMAALRRGHTKD